MPASDSIPNWSFGRESGGCPPAYRWRTFDQMAGSHLYNRIQAHEAAGATGHTWFPVMRWPHVCRLKYLSAYCRYPDSRLPVQHSVFCQCGEIIRRIKEFETKEYRRNMTNVDKQGIKSLFFRLKILFLCINLLIMWKSSNFTYIFRYFQTINNIWWNHKNILNINKKSYD